MHFLITFSIWPLHLRPGRLTRRRRKYLFCCTAPSSCSWFPQASHTPSQWGSDPILSDTIPEPWGHRSRFGSSSRSTGSVSTFPLSRPEFGPSFSPPTRSNSAASVFPRSQRGRARSICIYRSIA